MALDYPWERPKGSPCGADSSQSCHLTCIQILNIFQCFDHPDDPGSTRNFLDAARPLYYVYFGDSPQLLRHVDLCAPLQDGTPGPQGAAPGATPHMEESWVTPPELVAPNCPCRPKYMRIAYMYVNIYIYIYIYILIYIYVYIYMYIRE